MSISSVQNFRPTNMCQYKPQFKGQSDVKEVDKGDYIERHIKTEPSTGKIWGVTIASVIPGLGQFINGDIGKGFAFLGAGIASFALVFCGLSKNSALSYIGKVTNPVIGIWSAIDALRNAKSETVQIVNKSNNEQLG